MILSRIASGIPLALSRLRGRLPRAPRHGYIGANGNGNLGDDVVFEAACRLLDGRRLMTLGMPRQESVLGALGLSGQHYFSSIILGGGTLINTWCIEWVKGALEQCRPVWAMGTGVGSCGFLEAREILLDPWRPLLARFTRIGVRGFRSRRRLLELGVPNVEVVGDLALALTPPTVAAPSSRPTVAVNVTLPPPQAEGPGGGAYFDGFARAVVRLRQQGWEVLLVAMQERDAQALRELCKAVNLPERIFRPKTAQEFINAVGGCTMMLAVRLHAAVLACCAGVPPVLVGYRDKCLDFMESMGLEAWHVPEDDHLADRLVNRALALAEAAGGMRADVHRRALGWRGRLSSYVQAALEAVEPPRLPLGA